MSGASEFVVVDLVPLATAALAALTCALLGNLLVLRRATLMADALSHSVLPGLVAGFLLAGGLVPSAMLLGGVAAGLATAALVALLRRARVESSAALGATFATLFALGIVMLASFGLEDAHLSVEDVLAGHLATLIWFPPPVLGPLETWHSLPAATRTVAIVALIVLPTVWLLRKELVAAAFDPAFARTSGLRPGLLEFTTLALVSAAAVAAFEAVGSVLVVALFTCPAAAARLWTRRVGSQVALSALLALGTVLVGYAAAAFAPAAFGASFALAPSGVMAVVAASVLALAACTAGPRRRSQAPVG
jgi:manganese/zinc/iron transport system permease protein